MSEILTSMMLARERCFLTASAVDRAFDAAVGQRAAAAGGKNLCRYDHAIAAIEALNEYLDLSPKENNTTGLIANVTAAVQALEAIEKGIECKAMGVPWRKNISAAMDEFREDFAQVYRAQQEIDKFLKAHKEGFAAIEERFAIIKEEHDAIASVLHAVSFLEKFLRRLGKFEARVKKATEAAIEAK